MDFVSIRIITDDVERLASFYEKATGTRATRYTEDFAELQTPTSTLAIGSTRPSRCSRRDPPARRTTTP